MTSQHRFAFLVHPRAELAQDLGRLWPPLRRLPEKVYDSALRRLPLPPISMAQVHIDGTAVGHVVLVPFGARHLLAAPAQGRERVNRAVDKAVALGASVVGLGALTATVTGGGISLRHRSDIGVTNGNAYTAAVVESQVRRLLDDPAFVATGRRVAVVGASGSVGGAVTMLLARDAVVDGLTLIARSRPKLESLAARVNGQVPTVVSGNIADAVQADLVVLLTASADALLGPAHLAPGAVVLDATQPRNTSPELSVRRPDVLVVDGGVVDIPSLRLVGGDIGLPAGRAYACFAETAMLALTGHVGHFCLGAPDLARVDRTRQLAEGLGALGFGPAEPTSFGVPTAGRPAAATGTDRLVTRRVVMVGGGYVTLHACGELRRRLRREIRSGAVELVVISADDGHNFHGFTGEVLAGMMPLRRTRTPLERICRPATVIHARVTAVDRRNRIVSYLPVGAAEAASLSYHELIIGSGGREPADGIPGLAEHGYTLRGPGELARFAGVVDRLVADGGVGGRIVVAGGGLAGVELAAAVADRGRGRIAVDLVHAGPQLLPVLRAGQPRLARRAERDLAGLGVRVHPGVRLSGVTPGAAVLSDGTVLPAAAVLGVIGQRPVPIPGLGPDLRDAAGRLLTGPDLSVAEHVWAAGDAARVQHVHTGLPVPATALWAIKGGAHVGRNVAAVLHGDHPRRFGYRGLGQAASFGLGRSVAELYGVPFTGPLAWLLRLAFFLRFVPSRRTALAALGDVGNVLGGRRLGPDGRWSRPDRGQLSSGSASIGGRGSRRSDSIEAVSSSAPAPSAPRVADAAGTKSAESSGSCATPGTSPFSLVTHTPATACHPCARSITAVVVHNAT